MEYLNFLELGHMNSVISAQAIDGCMLVELVESDIDMQELGFSRFQTMKIKQRMSYPPHLFDSLSAQPVAWIRSGSGQVTAFGVYVIMELLPGVIS